ncbi:MAG: hypothetical protein Q9218_002041 [Villophora microphyllina]
MTAFVAVCLTLTNPYVFKISGSFLVWVFGILGAATKAWSNADQATSASSAASGATEREHLLDSAEPVGYGSAESDNGEGAQPLGTGQPADASKNRSVRKHAKSSVQSNQSSESEDTATKDQGASARTSTSTAPTVHSPGGGPNPKRGLPIRESHDPAIDGLQESSDSRETVWRYVKPLLQRGAREFRAPSKTMIVIATVLFGLFVAQTVAGIFSAKIASDKAGLSSSQHCGIWQYDDDAGEEAAYREDLLNNYNKEARASQYARTCYNSADPATPFSCNMFYNQSIGYKTLTNQPCPFASPEMCLLGLYSATTFDTGLVDASTIGINAHPPHKIRRKTTCSPLNMSEPYVQPAPSNTNETYRYHYGSKKDNTEYTFETSGHPFHWLAPVYSVNTYFSSLYSSEDYWQPLPSLKPPADSTLTIVFVSSMHIYHTKPSFDPIFYATEPRYIDGYRDPFYYNSDPRARVLACVDKTELCSPDGKTCWSMTAPVPRHMQSPPAYWLTKWSLENSNIYDSLKFRLGTALLAQESISQSISLPLGSNHWQLEASQLFATSLARIQYDAWDIAIGADREKPGYIEVTPDEAKGQLCEIVKTKKENYTNINLLAFLGLPFLAFTVFVLSWDIRTFPRVDAPKGHMVIDVIARWSVNMLAAALVGFCRLVAFVFHVVVDFFKNKKHKRHGGSPEAEHSNPQSTTV